MFSASQEIRPTFLPTPQSTIVEIKLTILSLFASKLQKYSFLREEKSKKLLLSP